MKTIFTRLAVKLGGSRVHRHAGSCRCKLAAGDFVKESVIHRVKSAKCHVMFMQHQLN